MATNNRAFTTAQLAQGMGGRVVGCDTVEVTGVQTLDAAGPNDVSFIINPSRAAEFIASQAGASLISKGIKHPVFDLATRALIEVDDADYSILHVLELFAPHDEYAPGVHESAVLAPGVRVAESASIGPHVSIEAGSVVGERCRLHGGVRIGRDGRIGDDTVLFHNVVISSRCVLGERVTIHNGASIGADGFNYRPCPDGSGLRKAQHLSHVVIEDDVEIGANSCIDRGKFSPTVIGAGSKIDNLVQIGHNCQIGRCVVIAGSTGIAGSVTIEDGAMIGGQAAIGDHATIGAGAVVCGHTSVFKTVRAGDTVFGSPGQPRAQMLRQIALLRRLQPWITQIENRIDSLEK